MERFAISRRKKKHLFSKDNLVICPNLYFFFEKSVVLLKFYFVFTIQHRS